MEMETLWQKPMQILSIKTLLEIHRNLPRMSVIYKRCPHTHMHAYVFTQPLRHMQNVAEGQFFKRSLTGFNSEFTFSYTGFRTKFKQHNIPFYLPGWHWRSSLTWDMRFSHIHYVLLISHPPTAIGTFFFIKKNISFQRKNRNCIKRFLGLKTFWVFSYRHKKNC